MQPRDLCVFSLAPFDGDRHGREVDLAHPDVAVRRRSLDVYHGMLELAANVGAPILGCHGRVGLIHALTDQTEGGALMEDSICRIAEHAARLNIRTAFEILNRYETHLVRDVGSASCLLAAVDATGL